MLHHISLPDDTYMLLASLAEAQGKSPEDYVLDVLQRFAAREWDDECAPFDDLTLSPQWQHMEEEAQAELFASAGESYDTDEALRAAFVQHG